MFKKRFTNFSYSGTKKSRNRVYRSMLKELLEDSQYLYDGKLRAGLCYLLEISVNFNPDETIEKFPELMASKPAKSRMYGGYWWKLQSTDCRLKALLVAIAATEK